MVQVAKLEKQRVRKQQQQGQQGIPVVEEVKQYAPWIGWGIVGVLLLVGGIVYYVQNRHEQNRKALTALSRILPYFERGEYQKALEGDPGKRIRGEQVIGLKQIVEQYSGTPGAQIAALFAGHALTLQGKFDEANSYYETAYESEALDVRLGGLGGIGTVSDAAFHYAEAAEKWEEMAEQAKERSEYQRYLLYSAQLYEVAKQPEKAEQLYREIILTTPFSYYAGFAKSGLVRLGKAIVPETIESQE